MFYSTMPEGDEFYPGGQVPGGKDPGDLIDYDKLADKIALRLFAMLVTSKPN